MKIFQAQRRQKNQASRVTDTKMSKAECILLVTIIGFYAVLCGALFLRAGVESIRARGRVAPKKIEVSKTVDFTRSERAWTRAVWRGTLA